MKTPASIAPLVADELPVASPQELREIDAHTSLRGREGGVTFRVVLLSLVLAVVLGYALPVIDYKFYNTFLGGSHLPPGAIGVLLLLVVVINPLLTLLRRKWALSRNEALTVYITCLFSSLVPGHGSENFIIPNLIAPFYFATRENAWLDFFAPYLKPWITPALNANGTINNTVTQGWYQGLPVGEAVPWGAWLVPMAFWMSFVLVSYVMFGCLSVMLRAQWAEREALAFPLLKLPLQMTEDLDKTDKFGFLGRFFGNPMMWCGFGIAVFIQMQRGLHLYFPDVPDFPLGIDTWPLFSEAPWNQVGWLPISIYPMVIGITYLLTSEISFSLWFFYLLMKFQYIAAYMAGYPQSVMPGADGFPDKLFTGNQMGGCYIAYVALILWTGREHFKHIALRAFRRVPAGAGEATEMMSYPMAFWGFMLSLALMIGATIFSGVRVDVSVALWISYLILGIGLARVAVEGGMLALQHATSPLGAIARLINTGPSGWMTLDNGASPASFFQAGMVNHMRGFIMPSFIHSFKLAHDHRIARRPLGALIVAVVLIAVVVSWITTVNLGYRAEGALTFGHTWWAKDGPKMAPYFLGSMSDVNTRGSAPASWFWLSFGALSTWGMMLMRSRFTWFPLHPIGYIMSLSYPSATFWFSIFLGWMFKSLISRFGGGDSYRKTIPLFLGLALGDVFMILFWLAIDGWQGRTGHLLLPG